MSKRQKLSIDRYTSSHIWYRQQTQLLPYTANETFRYGISSVNGLWNAIERILLWPGKRKKIFCHLNSIKVNVADFVVVVDLVGVAFAEPCKWTYTGQLQISDGKNLPFDSA